jgi:YD repeat-containing protein
MGRTTTVTFDSRGRKVLEVRGASATQAGIRVKIVYDDMGRVLAEVVDPATAPDGTPYSGSHLDLETVYEYDDAGRKTKVINPRGHETEFSYDAAGRLSQITDALSGTVVFAYNAAGEQTAVTNPRGKTSAKTYDPLGNVLTESDPLGNTYEYVYDAAGRRTQQTDPLIQDLFYAYDDGNRLLTIRPCTGGGRATTYIGYGYDAANRRTGMTDATGATSWTYDGSGLVTQVGSPQGTIGYAHDGAGRRETMTLPGPLGRLPEVLGHRGRGGSGRDRSVPARQVASSRAGKASVCARTAP